MKRFKLLSGSLAVALGLSIGALAPLTSTAAALDPGSQIQKGVTDAGGGSGGSGDLKNALKTVVNVLLFILGAIAVIVIVVGGLRYVTSGGDASQTKSAKDTILYAVIGLIIAILAYAIVNFVISSFVGSSNGGNGGGSGGNNNTGSTNAGGNKS